MAEGRAPEDLQEAVAATLRRLRGEVGAPRPAPARVEPQFTAPMPQPAAEELPLTPPPPAPVQEIPVAEATPPAEPNLLDNVASQTDIPPAPSSYEPQPNAPTAQAPELRSASSYDVEEAAEITAPPRRHWLRYVVALVVLVVFAAVGWWAYRHFVGRAGNGPIPVVTADQTPEKVPPADQPANQTPTQQETVYNQIAPGGSSTTQQPEVLLPQPETPAAPPVPSSSSQPSSATASNATASGAAGSATSGATPPAAPAAPAADTNSSTGNTTLTETLLPSAPAASSTSPTPAAPAAGQTQTSTAQAPASQPATTQTATAAPAAPAAAGSTDVGQAAAPAAPANDAPTAVGNYRVQLAALKTEADANSAWKRLAAKYPDVLGSLAPHLEKADLGSKGIYYRVQAGPFTDKNAARDVCAKLKTLGQPCLVKP